MECTLPTIQEEGSIPANGKVSETYDQSVSLVTKGKEDGCEKIELSSIECATLTIPCTATMIQTAVVAHVVDTADMGGASEAPLSKRDTYSFNIESADDLSDISGSVGASVVAGTSEHSWSSS
eukprot:352058-Ditylum_brightwellii.AAC.1